MIELEGLKFSLPFSLMQWVIWLTFNSQAWQGTQQSLYAGILWEPSPVTSLQASVISSSARSAVLQPFPGDSRPESITSALSRASTDGIDHVLFLDSGLSGAVYHPSLDSWSSRAGSVTYSWFRRFKSEIGHFLLIQEFQGPNGQLFLGKYMSLLTGRICWILFFYLGHSGGKFVSSSWFLIFTD